MRAALDATPLSVSTGGIRRYTEQLSLALARTFPADDYSLVSDQRFELPALHPANLRAGRRAGDGWVDRFWWLAGLPRELARLNADVFHGTDFAVPYVPLRPAVMTLHDVSPWRMAEFQPAAGRIRQRTPVLLGLRLATLVITPSEAVRREAIEYFQLPAGRVTAIPLAPSQPGPATGASPIAPPYFLFVGTLEPRKNLEMLIHAWRPVFETLRVPLVVAGRLRGDHEEFPPMPGLVARGEVSDAELRSLYTGALAVLFPSLYEGFGLPVLEAMQCGAPVIASRDPAIQETAGDAALLLDAADGTAWREAMSAAAEAPKSMAVWRERGRRRASAFSWEATARLTREVYVEARQRFAFD
jgi:glycosyltransferase involved in cell wall biosynthesis